MFRKADGLPETGVSGTGQGPNDEAGRPLIKSPVETACGTGGFDVCLQAVAAGFRETGSGKICQAREKRYTGSHRRTLMTFA